MFEIQKVINSIWNEEELPQQWKDYNSTPIYKKGNKTDCSNSPGLLLLLIYIKCYPTLFSER
jgi:hypothetical protein